MKTKIGYKLYEQNPDGQLFALFIDKKTPVPIGEWVNAEVHITKGFSDRPGIHCGSIPDAPWLKASDGTYKSQRSKYWRRVWCVVEYNVSNDYTGYVQHLPGHKMKGKVPENGYYQWKEAGRNRIWDITDKAKILCVLTEQERQQILEDMGYNEEVAFAPYLESFKKRMKTIQNG